MPYSIGDSSIRGTMPRMWFLASTLAFAEDAPLASSLVIGPLFTEGVMIDMDDPDSLRMDIGAGAHAAWILADGRLAAHLAFSARGDMGGGPPGLALTPSFNYRPGWTWMRFVLGVGAHVDTRRNWSPAFRFGAVTALGRSGWNLETTYITGGYVFGDGAISELYVGAGRNIGWSR